MIVLAIGVVIFKFFYMFVGSVYHYIPNDVIPPQFLTRYYGCMSILGSAATAAFNYFCFEYVLSHFSLMLWGTIIFYTVAMGFMCLALAFYLTIRMKIINCIRQRMRGSDNYVPHHGILFLAMIVRFLLLFVLGIQAYMALTPGSTGVAATMSAFDAGVDIIFVLAIIIFVKLDKLGAATNTPLPEN